MLTSNHNLAWEREVQGTMGVKEGVLLPDSKGQSRLPGVETLLSQSSGTRQEVPARPEPPLLPVLPRSHCTEVTGGGGWLLPDLAPALHKMACPAPTVVRWVGDP